MTQEIRIHAARLRRTPVERFEFRLGPRDRRAEVGWEGGRGRERGDLTDLGAKGARSHCSILS